MATPKIFVSSTCYDLHDLRNNLRNFIKNFDYEPVMSEFGDIFYDYNLHVQDACIKEIDNCQMFILIIGNNYGSSYYKSKSSDKSPASITLMEFKKALSINIPRHIFINRLVKYDYDNYRKFVNQKLFEYFNNNNVQESDIEVVKAGIRKEFDLQYYFPHESYKHIFKFFDIINELNMNNAIFTYETSVDIQEQLKKQWAGFMFEGLLNQSRKESNFNQKDFSDLISKIDKVDKLIQNLIKDDSQNGKVSLDINNIKNNINYSELEHYQELFDNHTYELIYNPYCSSDDKRRGYFNEVLDTDKVLNWLNSLNDTLKKYVWSKSIVFKNVFRDFECYQYEDDAFIPYKVVLELNQLFLSLSGDERDSFVYSITERLKLIEANDNVRSCQFTVGKYFRDYTLAA
jgi:hypothetical protein